MSYREGWPVAGSAFHATRENEMYALGNMLIGAGVAIILVSLIMWAGLVCGS